MTKKNNDLSLEKVQKGFQSVQFKIPDIPDNREIVFRTVPFGMTDLTELDDGSWEASGSEGLPWNRGHLNLEHSPELEPVLARGLATDPGALWKMRAMPQVAAALDDLIGNIVTANWRIKKPELLPWHEGNTEAEAELERQWLVSQMLWWAWTKARPEYDLHRWMTDVLTYSAVSGFYLGEANGYPLKTDIGDGVEEITFLELPKLRAPWTVENWLFQKDTPVGIVQILPLNIDDGKLRAAIPWHRLMHFTLHDAGRTDLEGYSIVRPAYRALQALQSGYQTQALAVAVNGLGTWVGETLDPLNPPGEPDMERISEFFQNYKAEHVPFILSAKMKLRIETATDSVPDLGPQLTIFERLAMLSLGQSHKLIGLHGHGSFAARSAAAVDAKDSYVYPADRLSRFVGRYLRKAIHAARPKAKYLYVPEVLYKEEVVEAGVQ